MENAARYSYVEIDCFKTGIFFLSNISLYDVVYGGTALLFYDDWDIP